MKKKLHKKRVKTVDSVYLYVYGGANETCTNPGCGGNGGSGGSPGNGCVPMGGNTVCHP